MNKHDIKRLKELMELRADKTLSAAIRAEITHDLQFHLLHAAPALLAAYEDAERMKKGLDAVAALINESFGVAGLHLNGDVATWEELRTGGRFEEWLVDFDAAIGDKP